jgi:hypothetical protein
MIWIDEILYASENEGLAQTELVSDQLYFDNQVFYPSAYIEFIAQAYAYTMALNGRRKNQSLQGCYLTSIDKMTNSKASTLGPGDILRISVKTIRNLHPAYVLEGKIFDQNNNELCSAKIKGFAFFEGEQLPFEDAQQEIRA